MPLTTFVPVVYDVLIRGRGMAGAVLAEASRLRGLSVHVFDHQLDGNATMAAGGAVNPVVFRRYTVGWGAAFLMPSAQAFYSAWNNRLGFRPWHDAPVVKLFADDADVDLWRKALDKPDVRPFIMQRPEPEIDQGPFQAPFGYGTVPHAGWLDIPRLLDAQRRQLLDDGALSERLVKDEEVQQERDRIRIGEVEGRWLVDCTGAFSSMTALVPVKGITLTVRIPGLHLTSIVHGGAGLIPVGGELFHAGSTYSRSAVWTGPSAEARDGLLACVQEMVKLPLELLDVRAGVRPAARGHRPILGPVGGRQAVLNGLGMRGVMQAPWCANHLLDHLFEGKPLGAEVDVARFSA